MGRRRGRTGLVVLGAAGAAALVAVLAVGTGWLERSRLDEQARSPQASDTAQSPPERPAPGPLEVVGHRPLSERSTEYRLRTDLVPAADTQDGPTAIVTLPQDYDPDRSYPTLYLLTGTDAGESPRSWLERGALEESVGELQAIVVAVDDGSYGWYTDWTASPGPDRAWRTFHLEQVVPWVDQTFPTLRAPASRAVAGASAGGFGAMSYAQQRPDLFGAAVSFSGLLGFEDAADRRLVLDESRAASGEAHALFGDGEHTTQADWDAHDPSLHTDALRGMPVRLYTGDADEFESRLARSAERFADRARASGADVEVRTYAELADAGAAMPAGECSGGHEWTCWSMALHDLAPDLQEHFDAAPRPR